MNLKLNSDVKGSIKTERSDSLVKDEQSAKRSQREEERRRTGRYMAILVGICLFILALYHAWVRRIPIVASLVVPALIMFVYVAWIMYTASREKHRFRLFDVEVGQQEAEDADGDVAIVELTQSNVEISVMSSKDSRPVSPEDTANNWTEIPSVLNNNNFRCEVGHNRLPLILVNDKPPEDLDQKWFNIIELSNNEKLKILYKRRRFKRRFCRSRRHAAPKRSYSIG